MTDATPEPEPEPEPEPKPNKTAPTSLANAYAQLSGIGGASPFAQLSGVGEMAASILAPIQAAFAVPESMRAALVGSDWLPAALVGSDWLPAALVGSESMRAALASSESMQAISRAAQKAAGESFKWDQLTPSVPALNRLAEGLRATTAQGLLAAARPGSDKPLVHAARIIPAQVDFTEVVAARTTIADLADVLAKSIERADAGAEAAAAERKAAAEAAAAVRKSDIRRDWVILVVGILGGGLVTLLAAALVGHN